MALVPAWDKRTGQQVPHPVPKRWLDTNLYPHLAGEEPKPAEVKATQAEIAKTAKEG